MLCRFNSIFEVILMSFEPLELSYWSRNFSRLTRATFKTRQTPPWISPYSTSYNFGIFREFCIQLRLAQVYADTRSISSQDSLKFMLMLTRVSILRKSLKLGRLRLAWLPLETNSSHYQHSPESPPHNSFNIAAFISFPI